MTRHLKNTLKLAVASLSVVVTVAIAEPQPRQEPMRLSATAMDGVTAGASVGGTVTVAAAAAGLPVALTSTTTFSSTMLQPSSSGNGAQDATLVVVTGSAMAYGGIGGSTATAVDSDIVSATDNTIGHTHEINVQGVLASYSTVFSYEVGLPASISQGPSGGFALP